MIVKYNHALSVFLRQREGLARVYYLIGWLLFSAFDNFRKQKYTPSPFIVSF